MYNLVISYTQSGGSNISDGKQLQLCVYIWDPIMCSPFYLISLLVICAVAGQAISVIILDYFFSTQRERKLNGSSLIVALVSLFSFLKATKCIAFHSYRLDVSIVSQLQLLYESTRLRSARTRFRDRSVKTTSQIPDHIISKDSTRYSKRSTWRRFWLLQSLFCLRRFCPGVFVFFYIIYMNESKLLKALF